MQLLTEKELTVNALERKLHTSAQEFSMTSPSHLNPFKRCTVIGKQEVYGVTSPLIALCL